MKYINQNVKALGIYFGNNYLNDKQFKKLLEKIKNSMKNWKSSYFTINGKTYAVCTFILSKLCYSSIFFPLNEKKIEIMKNLIEDFMKYPPKKHEIHIKELQKEKGEEGISLIN